MPDEICMDADADEPLHALESKEYQPLLVITCTCSLIFTRATHSIARYLLRHRGWLSRTGIVSKRLNLS